MKLIFILTIILVYLLFVIRYTVKICTSPLLSRGQKVLHIALTWLLPFLWIPVVRYVLFSTTKGSFEIDVKNDESTNNYYESGKGAPGSGIGFK
ncbi:hypothetical protein [Arcticibacter sp. MXS-1]|uniref:hypothetical protein n=1 Tax=Arcticibacter sp. MXS-1 TaxID=3341726 RepID=UPI0035A91515